MMDGGTSSCMAPFCQSRKFLHIMTSSNGSSSSSPMVVARCLPTFCHLPTFFYPPNLWPDFLQNVLNDRVALKEASSKIGCRMPPALALQNVKTRPAANVSTRSGLHIALPICRIHLSIALHVLIQLFSPICWQRCCFGWSDKHVFNGHPHYLCVHGVVNGEPFFFRWRKNGTRAPISARH